MKKNIKNVLFYGLCGLLIVAALVCAWCEAKYNEAPLWACITLAVVCVAAVVTSALIYADKSGAFKGKNLEETVVAAAEAVKEMADETKEAITENTDKIVEVEKKIEEKIVVKEEEKPEPVAEVAAEPAADPTTPAPEKKPRVKKSTATVNKVAEEAGGPETKKRSTASKTKKITKVD